MAIRVTLKKYLPDLFVLGLLVAFYLHNQAINEQIYSILEHVTVAKSTDVEYDINHEFWKLSQSVNQLWIYFILFIVIINVFRKQLKCKDTT
jgi:hypothetical protein